MSNRYYNHTNPFLPGTTAKSSEVNAELDGIAAGLDKIQLEIDAKTQVSNATPLVPAAAPTAGTSVDASRADHVHPLPSLIALGAAAASHTHAIGNVTGLQTALDAKADVTTTTAALNTKADATATTNALALKMDKAGGSLGATTLTGTLTLAADATAALHAVTKQQMDAGLAAKASNSHTHAAADVAAVLSASAAAALGASALTGTATVAARADHVHPYPTAAQVGAAAASHTHVITDVTGLQTALNAKADTSTVAGKLDKSGGTMTGPITLAGPGPGANDAVSKQQMTDAINAATGGPFIPLVHSHAISDVTGLQTALNDKASLTQLAAKLDLAGGTMTGALTLAGNATANLHAVTKQQMDAAIASAAPTAHTHTIANVTGLQAALDGKADAGTTSSGLAARLPLSGGTISGDLTVTGNTTFSGTTYSRFQSRDINATTGSDYSNVEVRNAGGTGDGGLAAITFHCTGQYASKLYLRADGYFGIGTISAGAWRWYVNQGSGDMTAAGNVISYSDPRLKEDVTPIGDALAKIKQLNGVRFRWKDLPFLGHAGEYDYGVLANEVAAVAPELVADSVVDSDTGDRYKAVAYDKLAVFAIEAIKQLAVRVEALEAKLEGKA